MENTIPGLHHVTAITADAQANVDFYTGLLGLRLVKLTVNFDDPGSYHLYYGDELGRPGSILTYFAWPYAERGRRGASMITATALSVPPGALDYWSQRFTDAEIAFDEPVRRFGDAVLAFFDPDGMPWELVAAPDGRAPWAGGGVPVEHAIRGLHSVALSEEGYERTAGLLTQTLGFTPLAQDGNRFRYGVGAVAGGAPGALVDVLCQPDAPRGQIGAGSVHHVAWRTPDDTAQQAWREQIAALGYNVSPVMDRTYFHSIYFREPGGVLFEIATDAPGFTADEPAEQLGTRLQLPPWLEPMRARIEAIAAPLRLP